jgi:sulfonate transport system ATP-binding protein
MDGGVVSHELPVPVPRPRDRGTAQFAALRARLLTSLGARVQEGSR